jgi:hypothetical protein
MILSQIEQTALFQQINFSAASWHMVLFETQFRPNEIDGDDKGLSAPHIGICQFAICDGSVRAITDHIDAQIYNALGTRQGGEVIEGPQ